MSEKNFEVPNGQMFSAFYSNGSNLLPELCDDYGSDKGSLKKTGHNYPWEPHNYTDVYSLLFDHCRFSVRCVFECGIGTSDPDNLTGMGAKGKPGASLLAWYNYFPNAKIFGADIDANILFFNDRTHTFQVDQTKKESVAELNRSLVMHDAQEIDLAIDDGAHTFEAGATLFEGIIDLVSGVYVIEDVQQSDFEKYVKYFESKPEYAATYINLHRKKSVFTAKSLKDGKFLKDNSMIIIRKRYNGGLSHFDN